MYYTSDNGTYDAARYVNGSLDLVLAGENDTKFQVGLPPARSIQFMKLELDGHFRLHEYTTSNGWTKLVDIFDGGIDFDDCSYPTVCGSYGVCSNNGQCSCPATNVSDVEYFKLNNPRQPNLGCCEITPLSCETSEYHRLLYLVDISDFNYVYKEATGLKGVAVGDCMQACLQNCSHKAAMFTSYDCNRNLTYGYCFLPSEALSLINSQSGILTYWSSAYIKIQIPPTHAPTPIAAPYSYDHKPQNTRPIIRYILESSNGAFLIVVLCVILVMMIRSSCKKREDYLGDDLPEMAVKFTNDELKSMTANFHKMLGRGGFGSVYEGTLQDNTKVAVKRLENIGQG